MRYKHLLQLISTPLPSFLRKIIYRMTGAEIGRDAVISPFSVLLADKIRIGPRAEIKPFSLIAIPSEFEMGAYSVLSNFTILHGRANFYLGPRAHLGAQCLVDLSDSVHIGEYSGLAPRVVIMTHNVHRPVSWGYKENLKSPVIIEDMVSIGFNTKICHGVTIPSETKVIPGSIILKSILSSSMIYDSPLKRLCLPLSFSKNMKITAEFVETCIMNAAKLLCSELWSGKGITVEKEADYFMVKNGSRKLKIHFFKLSDKLPGKGRNWLFGYNFDDIIFQNATDYCVLDFTRLLYSSNSDRELLKAAVILRQREGYRFADFKDRECFKLKPPSGFEKKQG